MNSENLYFLQALAKFLEQEEIFCSCAHSPRLNRDLLDKLTGAVQTQDREALEAIAACLRNEALSDFVCVEEICALVEARGFSTLPRHDF